MRFIVGRFSGDHQWPLLGDHRGANAGCPLASKLLRGLSDWLDRYEDPEDWVNWCRNRIVQVRETFGSLDDFEGILGTLEEYGYERVKPTGATTYRKDYKDLFHDCTKKMQSEDGGNPDVPAEGFTRSTFAAI
jgi:hypothetical protein